MKLFEDHILVPDNLETGGTLEETWWVMDREPGMDDVAVKAGKSLAQMGEDLKIYPFQDRQKNDRLFLAQYRFPQNEDEAPLINFLAGFPIDCVEMLVIIGELTSKAKTVAVKEGIGAAAPVPDRFFTWPDSSKVLVNKTALLSNNVRIFEKSLPGGNEPQKAHWWLRVALDKNPEIKFPIPGEFLALGVRMMPDKPWGRQKSSPFLYSGNWMDTIYYTGAVIREVLEPTDDIPYPRYMVQWRKELVEAKPSDFAEYQVGDRVTILKDVTTEKTTQTWKDDDTGEFDQDDWVIVPITFYEVEEE